MESSFFDALLVFLLRIKHCLVDGNECSNININISSSLPAAWPPPLPQGSNPDVNRYKTDTSATRACCIYRESLCILCQENRLTLVFYSLKKGHESANYQCCVNTKSEPPLTLTFV